MKCTIVQALRFCTSRTAHRGRTGIALLFLDHGTRRGWGVSVTLRPLFTPRKDPAPIVQEVGWASRPVWTGEENLAPTGIRSPDRPARSQTLYRLRYPGPRSILSLRYKNNTIPPLITIRPQTTISMTMHAISSLTSVSTEHYHPPPLTNNYSQH